MIKLNLFDNVSLTFVSTYAARATFEDWDKNIIPYIFSVGGESSCPKQKKFISYQFFHS